MLFLLGERIHERASPAGRRRCGVCHGPRDISRVRETNYFCVFGLRLLPIETVADYLRCTACGATFDVVEASAEASAEDDADRALVPACQLPLKQVIAYLLLGYGLRTQTELAEQVAERVGACRYPAAELNERIKQVDIEHLDILAALRGRASSLDAAGKQRIIAAAFLVTHACCEMQHEDRLRINLMGNALGESLEFVEAAIEQVRGAGYFGVRRLLAARSVQG